MIQDILLNSSYDLSIKNGDFVVGDSNTQHQSLLILCSKGDYKYSPLVGIDAMSHLHDNRSTLARDTRIAFIADGMKVRNINNVNGKLIIDAEY